MKTLIAGLLFVVTTSSAMANCETFFNRGVRFAKSSYEHYQRGATRTENLPNSSDVCTDIVEPIYAFSSAKGQAKLAYDWFDRAEGFCGDENRAMIRNNMDIMSDVSAKAKDMQNYLEKWRMDNCF